MVAKLGPRGPFLPPMCRVAWLVVLVWSLLIMNHHDAPNGVPFLVPRVDDHEYRLIKLPNGLKALLVRDPTCDKAAAACDVSVGGAQGARRRQRRARGPVPHSDGPPRLWRRECAGPCAPHPSLGSQLAGRSEPSRGWLSALLAAHSFPARSPARKFSWALGARRGRAGNRRAPRQCFALMCRSGVQGGPKRAPPHNE